MEKNHSKTLTLWVDEYTDYLYDWALHKVSDAHLAEDLVQETFLVAAEKIDSFKNESSPKTWLLSIINFKIIDIYRSKSKKHISLEENSFDKFFDEHGGWKTSKTPLDWHDDEGHLLDNCDFQHIFNKCLDTLPEKWNICVKLKYLSDKKGEDICQEIGLTTANYWQIVHRAKLQLRDCIETNWFKK